MITSRCHKSAFHPQVLSVRDIRMATPWKGKPRDSTVNFRCRSPNSENHTENPPDREVFIIEHQAQSCILFCLKQKWGWSVSIIFSTAASIWEWSHHTPSLTPLTPSPQKGWWGALSYGSAELWTDPGNTLKCNMRLLPAEQLWAQIGFFYYGRERPREILIRQTGTVSENIEMPALLVFPRYWTCLSGALCSYFN